MRCLAPGENPWINCVNGNERCKKMDPPPVHFHYPFEWYNAVHVNVKRTMTKEEWRKTDMDRSLPGRINAYGQYIIKEMNS